MTKPFLLLATLFGVLIGGAATANESRTAVAPAGDVPSRQSLHVKERGAHHKSFENVADGSNTFTAIARDGYGRVDTNTTSAWLPASANYSYDANGNLTFDGRKGFEYDDENQLVRVTRTNEWKTEFAYDGKLRLRVRKEYTWSGSWVLASDTRYVYDGMLVIQERDANNVPTVSYTRGKDLSGTFEGAGGIGGLLARTDATQSAQLLKTAYYHADGNGNITALMSTNGLIIAHYQYDPYGRLLAQSGPLSEANRYRFSSKEWQPNSGLYYYGYRFYEPETQRWVNRDPFGELGFETSRNGNNNLLGDGPNQYTFVQNQAISGIDAYGEKMIWADCYKWYRQCVADAGTNFSDCAGTLALPWGTGAVACLAGCTRWAKSPKLWAGCMLLCEAVNTSVSLGVSACCIEAYNNGMRACNTGLNACLERAE